MRIGEIYRYTYSDDNYLLSRVYAKTVVLINIDSGNRFSDPVEVINPYDITPEEFDRISDVKPTEFVLIPDAKLTIN